MGGKSSKEKAEPETKGKKETNPKTQIQNTVQIKGGIIPQQHNRTEKKMDVKLSAEQLRVSHVRSLLDLFFSSERLKDLETDEELIAQPLKQYGGSSKAAKVMKEFMNTIKRYNQGSQGQNLEDALKALSEVLQTSTPSTDLFNVIQTAFKIVRLEKNGSSESVLTTLKSMANLPLSEIEGTEIEAILFNGLLKDIDEIKHENHADEDSETKLVTVRNFLQSEDAVWPLCKKLPNLNKMIDQLLTIPQEDLHAALESYLKAVRGRIVKDLEGKAFNSSVIGPFGIDLSPLQFKLYKCLPLLTFGYLKVDGRKLLARVKKVSLQIYREPDFETIKSLELSEFVSLKGRILGYDEPFFKSVTVESLVERVALMEDNPNIKSDYEPICLYIRDNKVNYCFKKAALADRGEAYGNSNMMRLCLVKQNDFYDSKKFRIVIAPNGILDSPTHFMYFMAIEKDATLQTMRKKFETVFSNVLGNGTKMIDQLLDSLVFSYEVAYDVNSISKVHKKSADVLRGKGWDTKMSDIVSQCGQDNSAQFDESKENKADLVITLNRGIFKAPLQGNSWIDSDRSKFIKLKPVLTDLFEQVIGEDFRSNRAAYTEERVRELTPNYLYVDISETANIFDCSPDLKLNFFNEVFDEYGMEYSPKYRAIGFVAQKLTQEFYTVLPDPRYPNKFYARKDGQVEPIKADRFDPNTITGIYYQRCTKEL